MQISCPQCATAYELDERVLPPGGAPVQCTRCSHVFTAEPPRREVQATQVFGAVNVPPAISPSPDEPPSVD
ncbi:MAG TPA: zinc-ribbon domain-containing protein, partial [Myxococcaceae bacterium]|nr:zinc-ribbon domain-containing protein [Myxococcaceae bacterium]